MLRACLPRASCSSALDLGNGRLFLLVCLYIFPGAISPREDAKAYFQEGKCVEHGNNSKNATTEETDPALPWEPCWLLEWNSSFSWSLSSHRSNSQYFSCLLGAKVQKSSCIFNTLFAFPTGCFHELRKMSHLFRKSSRLLCVWNILAERTGVQLRGRALAYHVRPWRPGLALKHKKSNSSWRGSYAGWADLGVSFTLVSD